MLAISKAFILSNIQPPRTTALMNLLNLIGDIDENFYQLGIQDRESAKYVHQDVKLMLSTPWKPINKALEEVAKIALKNSLLKKTDYYNHLKSYSEGLGKNIEETAYVLVIPELVSCMSKWAPGFVKGNFGCSSLFFKNMDQQVVHARILDFPLQGSYDQYERAILYDLKGMPKTLGFGSAGIPYPSITLMTEDGMTLALHQKFTNLFNKNGVSIFELIFELLKNANDKKSVIEFLKSNQSITTWCLYMSFKNGDGLAIDIMGDDLAYNEFSIDNESMTYFCNHLIDQKLNQEDFLPTGFNQYNKMREEIAHKKIHHLMNKNEKREIEILKYFSQPYKQKKISKGEQFKLDPLTPSSLSIMTLNPSSQTAYYIPNDAPKVYRGEMLEIKDSFSNPVLEKKISKKATQSGLDDYHQGLSAMMKAQKGFDLNEPQMVYHNLQIAIDHLENYPEKYLATFYFYLAQYINENHSKVLTYLLSEFKTLKNHLPENLTDHCNLFILRLELILDMNHSIGVHDIRHHKLKQIWEKEAKIPKGLFHLTTRNMIVPRIDISDVIYLYTT